MSTRPARYVDLDWIADVLIASFWSGDIVGRFMHPYRAQYPGHSREWWKRRLRAIWWDPRYALLVLIGTDGTVAGFAQWKSHGTSEEKGRLWALDPRRLSTPLASFYNALSSLNWSIRSVDPTAIQLFEEAALFLQRPLDRIALKWVGA
ncbi:hypothetical protein Vi05172_g2786 [Venturia inaequalis]|nr:hypothetical protein Vi05172_g2786 [Venturia inaequalis]